MKNTLYNLTLKEDNYLWAQTHFKPNKEQLEKTESNYHPSDGPDPDIGTFHTPQELDQYIQDQEIMDEHELLHKYPWLQ